MSHYIAVLKQVVARGFGKGRDLEKEWRVFCADL